MFVSSLWETKIPSRIKGIKVTVPLIANDSSQNGNSSQVIFITH